MLRNFLYIFLVTSAVLFAEKETESIDINNYRVESFSFDSGISHQMVYDLFKDSKGYLWFGTMYGLVQYMGSEIQVYRHDPNNPATLSNDDITKIYEDSKGNIWVTTFGGGFNKIDLQNDTITRYTPSGLNLKKEWNGITWDIIETNDGEMLVATDNFGIIKLEAEGESVERITFLFNGEVVLGEKEFSMDTEGNLFIVSPAPGIQKYDPKSNEFLQYEFPGLEVTKISHILDDNNGSIWIASANGVIKYNKETNDYVNLKNVVKNYPEQINFKHIFIDGNKNIWLGGFNHIYLIDKNLSIAYEFSPEIESRSIHPGPVIGIVEDNHGIIWSGQYQGGINKIYSDKPVFKAFTYKQKSQNGVPGDKVQAITQFTSQKFAIGTNNGLSIYNSRTGTFTNYFTGSVIFSSIPYSENSLLIGSQKGLFWVDDDFTILKKFEHNTENEKSITAGAVISLLRDNNGFIWAGTTMGLNKINLETGEVTRYTDQRNGQPGISGYTVLSLYQDKDGYIYAGTYSGLNKFHPDEKTFTLYTTDPDNPTSISNNYVFDYLEDSRGSFWLATGNGINKYDKVTEKFSRISEDDGLSNNVTYGIEEYNNHLFISTAEGISVMNLDDRSINVLKKTDGLHGNMFGSRAHLLTKDNNIIFGGKNGFTIIDTDKYFEPKDESNVNIVSVSTADEQLLNNLQYKSTDEVTVPYNSSYVRIHFTSPDFRNPESFNFKYRLEGLDTTWINSDGSSFAQYPKIPSGEYIFRVKANSEIGFKSSKEASIRIMVPPPFWQTPAFYLAMIALVLTAVYLAHRLRVRAELKRAEEIEKIRNEEETKLRKKAADDFHDELGHRITKISLYSELLKRTIKDQESGSSEYLKKISDISSSLSTGVKDFIWTLDPGKDTLYDVAIRLKDFGDDLFDKSGISFRTSGINENFQKHLMPMDWRRHIILIFKEAMNNILKYSNAENVMLGFELANGEVDISLADDGTGFDIDNVSRGRGLNNIRMRAASVNGKIEIESTKETGTSIRLHSIIP